MSGLSTPWDAATRERLLATPASRQHVAQLYTQPVLLVEAVGRYAAEGLLRDEAVLLVARVAHGRSIVRRLASQGLDLPLLVRRGQLTILDAASTLSRLLVAGEPVSRLFRAEIGGAVAAAKRAGYPTVRGFGEMVDLLRKTSEDAALELEALWNELLAEEGIAFLCGYSLDAFDPTIYDSFLPRVAAAHSHVVPVEDLTRLERAVELAYVDVFGTMGDGGYLRRAFLAHYVRPAAMPDAQAAILAAREFVPADATAALLDRARHHYREDVAPST